LDARNSIDDLLGRVYLSGQLQERINGYFDCVKLIRPLLNNLSSQQFISGSYLNVSGEHLNSVRLSYFTNDVTASDETFSEFLNKHGNITALKYEVPHKVKFSDNYDGEELRFRSYLNTYTKIGLDLLDYDLLYSRRLVATYRLTYSPQKRSCRPLFEPAFIKHSNYYNLLDVKLKNNLWEDLDFWYSNNIYGDWAHMLVNMLLPGDFPYIECFPIPNPRPPITGIIKIHLLSSQNLDLPEEWNS